MKVKLTKLLPGRKQKKMLTGEASYPPRVGEPFVVCGPYTFEKNSYTQVRTSPVTDVLSDGKFRTVNGSLYKIEILAREWN
jgi:hypothetical protein